MSSSYLVLFQIGSVQDYINQARKINDLWAGSNLLSFLCSLSINDFENSGGEVIFPKETGSGKKFDGASLPNRFLGMLDTGNPAELLEHIKIGLLEKWKEFSFSVKKSFEGKIPGLASDPKWEQIWNRQIPEVFEIFYVWVPWNKTEVGLYSQKFLELEGLLGVRKLTRFSESPGNETGQKCSICGIREALTRDSQNFSTRESVKEFWDKIRNIDDFKYIFKESEHLCAPCTVKRLTPKAGLKFEKFPPSTSTIAVSGFLKKALEAFSKNGEGLKVFEKDFSENLKILSQLNNEPWKGSPLSHLREKHPDCELINIEGDWFYEETYQKFENLGNGGKDREAFKQARDSLKKFLKDFSENSPQTFQPPSKYLALASIDVDNMGRILGTTANIENHRKISQFLVEFSRWVFEDFQKRFLSYVVYFGGDDGLIFFPLEDLFPALQSLRDEWETIVAGNFPSNEKPTLSAGICIFHHQHPLRDAIQKSRKALQKAKSLPEKDSFAFIILKRSGEPVEGRAKWKMEKIKTLEVLRDFQNRYENNLLSEKWLFDFARDFEALKEYPGSPPGMAIETTNFEIRRLLKRHWAKSNTFDDQFAENVCNLHLGLFGPPGLRNKKRLEDFISLMSLAIYVSRGGGR